MYKRQFFRFVSHFQNGSDIIFHTHLTEYGSLLSEVADTGLCPFVNRIFGNLKIVEENALDYFVSYYDYYQPEAYIPTTDTYIAVSYTHLRYNGLELK